MIYNQDVVKMVGSTLFYQEAAPFAQGDLLLVPVGKVDDSRLQMDSMVPGAIVLALGEATGHAHAIYTDDAETATIESFVKQSPRDVPRAKRQLTQRFKVTDTNKPFMFKGTPVKFSDNIICLLRVGDVAPLTHDEHHTHMLVTGDWLVLQQHELRHGEMMPARD